MIKRALRRIFQKLMVPSEPYYLADNDVSKEYHKDNPCKGSKEVTATGTVSEKDVKKVLTISKIEAAK